MATSVVDVSKYILHRKGEMTTMKLQKLVYYSYSWHLVWTGTQLFPEKFQAWKNGPVCYPLFDLHRRKFKLSESELQPGDISRLSDEEISSIEIVLDSYGKLSSGQLSDLTHSEDPWREARFSISGIEIENSDISDQAIFDFYSKMPDEGLPISELAWPK